VTVGRTAVENLWMIGASAVDRLSAKKNSARRTGEIAASAGCGRRFRLCLR
jgi:hypothetical protein